MNNEERDLITKFFARVSGHQPAPGGGSVPATLPPIDPEANNLIQDNLKQYPEAAYRITQMAVVQEAALAEAQNRIRQLEWEVQQARAASQQSSQQQSGGGFFKSLFGGGAAQPQQSAPPPGWGQQQAYGQPQVPPQQPQGYPPSPAMYPPGYQRGMFARQGSGFLGSALTTAAGVAGGMMVGNALSGLFGGHHDTFTDPSAGFLGGGAPDGTMMTNSDPFAGAGTDVDPNFDAGGDFGGDFGGGFDDGGDWGDNSF